MVKVPTLVIWGERDTALLPGCLEGLERCVPDLKLVRVPDATHWVARERTALVIREIEAFRQCGADEDRPEDPRPGEPGRRGDRRLALGGDRRRRGSTSSPRRPRTSSGSTWTRQAAKHSPFGATIAHGFLTLSMLPKLTESTFVFSDRKMGVNYGLNKVRFTAPVPAGAKIRGRFTLAKFEKLEGGVQTTWSVTVEREGGDKPVMVAESISRHYF